MNQISTTKEQSSRLLGVGMNLDKCGDCKLIEDEDANGEAWCSFHQKPVRCYSKACEDILEKGGEQ